MSEIANLINGAMGDSDAARWARLYDDDEHEKDMRQRATSRRNQAIALHDAALARIFELEQALVEAESNRVLGAAVRKMKPGQHLECEKAVKWVLADTIEGDAYAGATPEEALGIAGKEQDDEDDEQVEPA